MRRFRYTSPRPSQKLQAIPVRHLGVLGTSLSGLDADGLGRMRYLLNDSGQGFHASVMSRKRLLPEADFYCPIRYAPLKIDTAFRALRDSAPISGLYLAAIPFLLHSYPFIQGITGSHHIGEAIGKALAVELTESASTATGKQTSAHSNRPECI
jgi:hypothetical protein